MMDGKRPVCPSEGSIQIILLISSRGRQYNFEDLMSTRYPRCSVPAGRSAEPSVRIFTDGGIFTHVSKFLSNLQVPIFGIFYHLVEVLE